MILRCAIDDGVGKWEPGTVLAWYPDDFQLNWGDKAHFLCIEVDSLSDDQKEQIRKRQLKIELNVELTSEQLANAIQNKQTKKAKDAKEIKIDRKDRVFKVTEEKFHIKDELVEEVI